jgi:hypothetical protein
MPPLRDPSVADRAPDSADLTIYDEERAITYVRMLDADGEGDDWREVARIVLHINSETEADRARRAFAGHLARAKMDFEMGLQTTFAPRQFALILANVVNKSTARDANSSSSIVRLTESWLPLHRGRSRRVGAMTRKEIAVEFVIPTMLAIAVGLCGIAAVAFAG